MVSSDTFYKCICTTDTLLCDLVFRHICSSVCSNKESLNRYFQFIHSPLKIRLYHKHHQKNCRQNVTNFNFNEKNQTNGDLFHVHYGDYKAASVASMSSKCLTQGKEGKRTLKKNNFFPKNSKKNNYNSHSFLSVCLSISVVHSNIDTHTQTLTHSYTRKHTLTHTQIHTLTHTHKHKHQTWTQTLHTYTQTHIHTHTHVNTHLGTHKHTSTLTHKHRHMINF